jgi:hypothetical protein
MSEEFYGILEKIYKGLRLNYESKLVVFAFIAELVSLCEMTASHDRQQTQLNEFFIEVIGEMARPHNFPDKVCSQFSQIFAELLERSPKLVASQVG